MLEIKFNNKVNKEKFMKESKDVIESFNGVKYTELKYIEYINSINSIRLHSCDYHTII